MNLNQVTIISTTVGKNPWVGKILWRKERPSTPVFLPRELHGQYEKAKSMTPEDEAPRSEGVQYDTGEEQINSPRKNEEAGSKQK